MAAGQPALRGVAPAPATDVEDQGRHRPRAEPRDPPGARSSVRRHRSRHRVRSPAARDDAARRRVPPARSGARARARAAGHRAFAVHARRVAARRLQARAVAHRAARLRPSRSDPRRDRRHARGDGRRAAHRSSSRSEPSSRARTSESRSTPSAGCEPAASVTLVIVGPQGWGEVGGLDRPGVRRLGPVRWEILDSLYRRARACCLPSTYEGFGLPAAEALARGCPVVASGGGAMAEIVGDAGILCPAGDVDAFSRRAVAHRRRRRRSTTTSPAADPGRAVALQLVELRRASRVGLPRGRRTIRLIR